MHLWYQWKWTRYCFVNVSSRGEDTGHTSTCSHSLLDDVAGNPKSDTSLPAWALVKVETHGEQHDAKSHAGPFAVIIYTD
jgi:hypothetical protein